ncbi:hypothetical protein [Arthrobacter sp.]|uniref:hypothetical protein n=1 Tax=Arthrobacter sp. TaxID=1667 RepID=UPI0026E0FF68|nr:hypothetical protein [Arthrobacter sp.]MDO5754184.1 hypothetical protein [Arthrobacter sp.]
MILGLLTLVVNYIVGITSSMAASHFDEVSDPVSVLSLPGVSFTVVILAAYGLAISVIAAFFMRKERIEIPELLADLHDARKFGALDSPRQIAHYTAELQQLRATREVARTKQFTNGDFDRWFTSEESVARPGFRQQIQFPKTYSHNRERSGYLHRRMLFNFHVSTGKWLILLTLLTAASLYFGIAQAVGQYDGGGDFSLLPDWGVAFVLGLASVAGQYRCDLGKVLLTARKEFISNATEAQCQSIVDQAAAGVSAASQPPHGVGLHTRGGCTDTNCLRTEGWEPFLRIGRWEAGRRAKR